MKVLVSKRSTGSKTYHVDPDCYYVRETHREWPIEQAETWDFTPCEKCAQKVKA